METQNAPVKPHRIKAAHLMCGTPIWGIAGLLACAYFAWLSYAHVRRGEFFWTHDSWSILAYAIWVLLLAGLWSETRCWRERIFFALVLANFTLGFVVAMWRAAPAATIHQVRLITTALWSLAALVSGFVAFSRKQPS